MRVAVLACAVTAGWAETGERSWHPPPARTADTPSFIYTPSPPDWRGIWMYQVITDRFEDGNPFNNRQGDGPAPNPYASDSIHGGDIRGLINRLDYIEGLGAGALWISPVQLNLHGAYHGYHITDFNRMDPHRGSLEELRTLVDAAHARGIYVILDIVVNHTARLVTSPDPGYPAFSAHRYNLSWIGDRPGAAPPFDDLNRFHGRGSIRDWDDPVQEITGDLHGLSDIRTEDPEVRRDLAEIYSAWIHATDCDGFRIDTVRHVEDSFWPPFIAAIKESAAGIGKTNFLVFGEALYFSDEQIAPYSREFGFDTMLDYHQYTLFPRVFSDGESPSLFRWRTGNLHRYGTHADDRLVTFLDNHDVSRFLHHEIAGGKEDALRAALACLFTTPGIPSLYYGTEQGFNGAKGHTAREDMFDGLFEQGPSSGDNFDRASPLYRWVRSLAGLRRALPELSRGMMTWIYAEASGPGLMVYRRSTDEGATIIMVNASAEPSQTNLLTHLDVNRPDWVDALTGEPVNMVDAFQRAFVPWEVRILTLPGRLTAPPPAPVMTHPPHDGRLAADQAVITIEFDRDMDADSFIGHVRIKPAIQGHLDYPDNRTVAWVMETPPEAGRIYRLTIDKDVRAVDGTPMGIDFAMRFHAASATSSDQVESPLGDFLPDGKVDAGARLVSGTPESGIYAAFDPVHGAFYVAAPAAADGRDRFILLDDRVLEGDFPGPPWKKSGHIATDGMYLADEADHAYNGWRNVIGDAWSFSGRGEGAWLEGVFNLQQHYGALPEQIFISAPAYGTESGGRMDAGMSLPPGDYEDGNVGPEDYIIIRLEDMRSDKRDE